MSWVNLREELMEELSLLAWREHEVRERLEWVGHYKRVRSRERGREWRWRQGERGRQVNRARCREYYIHRKNFDPAWWVRKYALMKADPAAYAQKLASNRAWNAKNREKVNAARRAKAHQAIMTNDVQAEKRGERRRAWRAANREHVRQYQRDYRKRRSALDDRRAR
jgi:hypothetical protein